MIQQFDLENVSREDFIREVTHIIDRLIKMHLEHPEISKILSRERIEGMPLSKDVHEEIFYPLIQKFYDLFKAAQRNKIVKPNINAAIFFTMLSEGVWGFYEIVDCSTSLRNDCDEFYKNSDLLKKQIIDIYLSGVLI